MDDELCSDVELGSIQIQQQFNRMEVIWNLSIRFDSNWFVICVRGEI